MKSSRCFVCFLLLLLVFSFMVTPYHSVSAKNKVRLLDAEEVEYDLETGETSFYKFGRSAFLSFNVNDTKQHCSAKNKEVSVTYSHSKSKIRVVGEREVELTFEIDKPTGIMLKIKTNMDFFYQPPLYEELNVSNYDFVNSTHAIRDGHVVVYRPLNVVGSYAVYYRGVKVLHIYRPKFIDASGDVCWGYLQLKGNKLKILCDKQWLKNADYPVLIDPTFGYTSIGGSDADIQDTITGSVFTLSTAGYAYNITVALRKFSGGTTFPVKCAIYRHSDLSLVAVTEEKNLALTTSYAWYTFSFSSPAYLSADDYVLVVWGSLSYIHYVAYDAGDTNQGHTQVLSYNSFPDPLNPTHDNNKYSLYATYHVPPTNDACDSDSVFYGDTYGWSNVTVSDVDGVADLNEVKINVTLADGKFFVFNWTQSSNVFAEVDDPYNLATLDTVGSVRTNVDSDTDIISFRFKIDASAQVGYANVTVTSIDDYSNTDTDIFADEFLFDNVPTNDEIEEVTLIPESYLWINVTVSDVSGISYLSTVDVNVTIPDGKVFILRWTESTNSSSEYSDSNNVITLDASVSKGYVVDSDTVKVAFYVKLNEGVTSTDGYAVVNVTSIDDFGLYDQDIYTVSLYIGRYFRSIRYSTVHK